MATSIDPYEGLLKAVEGEFTANKALALQAQEALADSEAWLRKFRTEYTSHPSARLIDAAHSAAVEVVAAISLGLARPAVFSLRCYFELFLMFLFYKDHVKELRAADDEVEFMKLPGEVVKYLRRYSSDFDSRWKILDDCKTRPGVGGYSRLSAIVHGSSQTAAPNASMPKDVCFQTANLSPLIALVHDIAEELSDVALSAQEGNWMSLPAEVQQSVTTRKADSALKSM